MSEWDAGAAQRFADWLATTDDEIVLVSGYVCAASRECTCSPHHGSHEPYCGLEPIMPAAEWMTFRVPPAAPTQTQEDENDG